MQLDSKWRLPFFTCLSLAIATLAVYRPVYNYEFIDLDDDVYVTNNTIVQSGLSWQNVKWAFTTKLATNWHPLTWLSLMLDCSLFGVKPGPMHLVNVAFHVANTVILLIIFNRMTKRLWPSAFVAALFALHPLHVESVAWVSERKDVLSTLFWLLTMLAYVRYAERPLAGRYTTAIVFFALGLIAKPMLVTLPFVLMLLDYWPLDRIRNRREASSPSTAPLAKNRGPKSTIRNLLWEKLPFLILTVISSIITYIVQQKGGAMSVMTFELKFYNAVCSYYEYIIKMLVPTRLAVLYPHRADSLSIIQVIISGIILVLITAVAFYYGRRFKYLIFGWCWYLGTLVPVSGLVQVGIQSMADRYTYIPLVGLFIIIVFGACDLLESIRFKKYILIILAAACLSCCIFITSAQLKYWQNSPMLFEHTLALTKNNFIILNNYGTTLMRQKKFQQAAQYLAQAVKIRPTSPDYRTNLGGAFKGAGRFDDAIEQYKIALILDPNYASAHKNLAIALALKGDYDGAIEQYKIYLGPDANVVKLYQDLASMLTEQGKADDAVSQLQKALAAQPQSADVLSNLGYTLAQNGKFQQAVEYYNQSLQLDPNNVLTHGRLALALAPLGKIDESIEHCRIVLAARPNDIQMYNNLGMLLRAKGEFNAAAESFKKALQIDPNFRPARDNLNALSQKQPQN
jgi:tetratricopeptide (TPR) repeat protein